MTRVVVVLDARDAKLVRREADRVALSRRARALTSRLAVVVARTSPRPPPRRTVGDVLSGVARLTRVRVRARPSRGRRARRGLVQRRGRLLRGRRWRGFGAPGDAAEYDYGTKDLAVDLASPLVAYKLVSWALNQEVPVWLDAIILAFTLAAIYVCLFDVNTLDDVLV